MFKKLWQTAFKEGTLSRDQQLTHSEKAPPTSQACKGRADTDSSQTSDFIYSVWIILITMFVYVYTDASSFKFQVHFHCRSSLAEFQTFNSPMLELLRKHREPFVYCIFLCFYRFHVIQYARIAKVQWDRGFIDLRPSKVSYPSTTENSLRVKLSFILKSMWKYNNLTFYIHITGFI